MYNRHPVLCIVNTVFVYPRSDELELSLCSVRRRRTYPPPFPSQLIHTTSPTHAHPHPPPPTKSSSVTKRCVPQQRIRLLLVTCMTRFTLIWPSRFKERFKNHRRLLVHRCRFRSVQDGIYTRARESLYALRPVSSCFPNVTLKTVPTSV